MPLCTACSSKNGQGITLGKSSPSPPAPVNAGDQANAQTASNQATALYNFGLNNPNTNSPLGNLTYTTDYTTDPHKPTTTENITLSPAEQSILDQYTSNTIQQGANAQTAQNNVTGLLGTPYDLKGNVSALPSQTDLQGDLKNTEDALYHQQTQYLDPQFQQSQAQLQSQLANQGIPQGSQAYTTAMNNLGLQKQQAYQSAMNSATAGGSAAQAQLSQTGLQNQAQQAQMYTQQYQEPLNLYSSLMSGTAPTMPQFNGINTANAAPTNVLGAYNNNYQGQLNSFNSQVGTDNANTSATASVASAAIGAAAMI